MRIIRVIFVLVACWPMSGCGSGLGSATDIVLTDNVVFVGDSITYNWHAFPGFQEHANWIDRGVAGQDSAEIESHFLSDILAVRPKTVHIVAGTNDVYPGWQSCASSAQGALSADSGPLPRDSEPNTCAEMKSMVETAKRYGMKVVIGTIPPWACAEDPYCGESVADQSAARYDRITELDSYLVAFAKQEGITIVDYHAMLADKTGLHYADGLTADGVHPSMAAYALMTPAVAAALE